MRRTLSLVVLLACGLARATEGICEHDGPGYPYDFEGDPYILTELNDPEFVPLGTALTYTTKKYNICDNGCADLAWHNAYSMAEDWLFDRVQLTTGEVTGWGCGGEVACQKPVRAHNVACTVEVGDCDYQEITNSSPYTYFRIKRTFSLDCLGDEGCKYEGRPVTDCCIITSTKR